MSKGQEEQDFKITDKRSFREDGERREEAPDREVSRDTKGEDRIRAERPPDTEPRSPQGEAKIDFPSYVLSYYTQGLVLLGEVPNPYTQKVEEDADAARHTIDILALLQEKTKGNLTAEEVQLLESVLYELRMKFMAKTKRIRL
ncbi:MAG: DUF1844 domain-containing protein [Acidobacteria bacterium]|nr:DUF1844 domain-containing protein [Acidobacteriota bacterium]